MKDYNSSLDILIVGSGFAGIYQLYQLRKLGYSVHVFDAADDTGGTWYWNCYPGARVDSETPLYQFSIQEIWKGWNWTERFPGWKELRKYFDYVDEKLDVKKDISFNTRVVSAHWDSSSDRWVVTTENGKVAQPRFLILCTGFSSMPYVPEFKGLDSFEGICHHTARWPHEDVDMKGKRVGVIGTGASGVQVIQEIGKDVKTLAVFQRTPNLAIAMQQRKLTAEEQEKKKNDGLYPVIFRRRLQTFSGFGQDSYPKSFLDTTPEERRLHWEGAWAQGGFALLLTNYFDCGTKDEGNAAVYAFWRQKVHARVTDPVKAEILAPEIPPHPFGAKRPSLEQTYYEVYNQPNVILTDLSKHPIEEITQSGVRTADGVHHELDILVLATGFNITATITHMDIRGVDGTSLKEKWAGGVFTNLGMTVANFPNLFYTYGPQAPTAFSNGPTCTEIQCDWITKCIKYMMDNSTTQIEPEVEAEHYWHDQVWETSKNGPWMKTKGWYNDGNIPGKPLQPLNYAGGTPAYAAYIEEKARKGYEGFILSTRLATGQIKRMDRKVETNNNDTKSPAIRVEA
ncbi:cyclohexanone monooxygenase [Dendrothele bispora CBS 962.96]|uniref:Cyclohexanone monooxygenase n=1 Tax=Dendrothele bispora (strain CBS 962.96) TaxID=1314807 RepID=A0A4S8M730_DENBC|nr:cyclohexanone monooxygenase [Dendrothele bispora CBS 962.96]